MKLLWIVFIAVVALTAFETRDGRQAHAQVLPVPAPPAIVIKGDVTVNGEPPAYSGFRITARIGDVWESHPVTVGTVPDSPFGYVHLLVAPPMELNLFGSQIEFWVNGEIKSTTTSYYAVLSQLAPQPDLTWSFPIQRRLDLDFPNLPDPQPNATVETTTLPDISKLRVGGVAMPLKFASIAMLAGLAFLTLGSCTLKRWT